LFERVPVGILPNLTSLLALAAGLSPAPRIAVAGGVDYSEFPYLERIPFANEEIAVVADFYGPGRVLGQERPDATREGARELLRHPDAGGAIFHVACHGEFVGGEPLRSGLVLSNGRLDAAEIARTPTRYEEVVLSACATGMRSTEVSGMPLSGDDIVGLPGAFLEAGVRSILVSITPAGDLPAMDFMTLYHEHRREGVPPLQALCATQRAMLSEGKHAPELWCGFVVYGCH